MAKRFGGKYSPTGEIPANYREEPVDERIVDAAGARSKWLIFPIVPLVFLSLSSGPYQLALALIAAAALGLAVWLLRDGLRAEAAYNARKIARRPALPRKMLATALTGIGVGITGVAGPEGGSPDKPVGFVCLRVDGGELGSLGLAPTIPGDRNDIRERAALVALHMIRRLLEGEGARPQS